MSTILKALRRLEEDRDKQAAFDRLHGEVIAPSPSALARRRWLWPALSVTVLALLGAGAWLVLPLVMDPHAGEATAPTEDRLVGPAAEEPLVTTAEPQPVRPSTAPFIPSAAPSEQAAVAATTEKPMSRAMAKLQRQKERNALAAAEAAASAFEEPAASAPEVAAPAVAAERAAKVARASSSSAPPIPEPAANARADRAEKAPAAPTTTRASTPRPASSGTSAATHATKPSPARESAESPAPRAEPKAPPPPALDLAVLSTVWHPEPARRVARVSIDGGLRIVKLREGDAYEGLTVSEIGLSKVVFERDGVSIDRRVGEGG